MPIQIPPKSSFWDDQFMTYAHLPPHLAEVSKVFCDAWNEIYNGVVALYANHPPTSDRIIDEDEVTQPVHEYLVNWVMTELPDNRGRTACLRAMRCLESCPDSCCKRPVYVLDTALNMLLLAKDHAVRCVVADLNAKKKEANP